MTGSTFGHGILITLSGTPDFTPFGDFMISQIHHTVVYILQNLSDYFLRIIEIVFCLCSWAIKIKQINVDGFMVIRIK